MADCRRCCARPAVLTLLLHVLIVAVTLASIGCSMTGRAPERVPPVPIPPVPISQATWWQVDSDIVAASQAAAGVARNYAHSSLANWKELVRQRTESDFIPWFTGYWTQQWLSVKMTWYRLNAGEDRELAVARLATYLQEQYDHRVLKPVAQEIDPNKVREQASEIYARSLGEQIQGIQRRYGIPPDQFDRRLKDIPAITLAPPAAHDASLHQVIHAHPIAKLPAYGALAARIRSDAEAAGVGPTDSRMSPVARRASEKLAAKLATSGGAGAAATIFGGIAGMIISLGAATYGAMAHESGRPELETHLRENLDAAMDDLWFRLLEDPATGVMAGVYSISGKIGRLARPLIQPVVPQPVPPEVRSLSQ